MIIAIDGLAGSGKSTAAKILAQKNGFNYISSGYLYRALTWFCLAQGFHIDNLSEAEFSEIENLSVSWNAIGNILINEHDVMPALRTRTVTESVVKLANHPRIRNYVSKLLHAAAEQNDLIIDGRDIGTVVFPKAELKFYLFAEARDRMINVARTGMSKDQLETLSKKLSQRDQNDLNRELAPLKLADDAFLIQTLARPQEETLDLMQKLIDMAKVFSGNVRIRSEAKAVDISEASDAHLVAMLTDKPTFANLNLFSTANIALFRRKPAMESHEVMIFRDLRIPYVQGVGSELDNLIGQSVVVRLTPRGLYFGSVHFPIENLEIPSLPLQTSAVLNSSYEGIQRLPSNTIEYLATRGEFIFLRVSSYHPLQTLKDPEKLQELCNYLITILSEGLKRFPKVIYRFTDFSYENLALLKGFAEYEEQELNYSLGNRGTLRLLSDHKELFIFEIEQVSNLYEQSSNLSVLLPYLRTVEEAVQATILIRKSFSGEIGCMLETPFILSIPHQLNSLFDFFVVGSSDLIQLVQGTDRSRIVFESGTIDYTIQLVETFVNNISDNKLIFVTNPAFYSKLKHYPNVRLLTK